MLTALAHLTIVALLAQSLPEPEPPVMHHAPPATPLEPAPPATPLEPTPPASVTAPAPPPTPQQPDTEPAARPQEVPPPPGDFLPPGTMPSGPPPPPPPPSPPPERRYADGGTGEVSLQLGYTQQTGFVGGGGYRRFIVDGFGPGAEASVQSHNGQTLGFLLGSLRFVPVRATAAALVLTARAGRVLLSDHDDGWGAGGSVGLIFFLSPTVGVEVSYAILWLTPASFCADLTSCSIRGPDLGLRVGF